MAKYIVWDEVKSGDVFTEEFNTELEAREYASKEWNHLAKSDQKRRVNFYILESANPDEEADGHFDGNHVKVYVLNGKETAPEIELISTVYESAAEVGADRLFVEYRKNGVDLVGYYYYESEEDISRELTDEEIIEGLE